MRRGTTASFQQRCVYRFFSLMLACVFGVTIFLPIDIAQAQIFSPFSLPAPGSMISPTKVYVPALIKGIEVDPNNPLHFDFIIDTGDSGLHDTPLRDESLRLVKYFLASLTIPEKEMWVNLSPYEQGRVIPEDFGHTVMGVDLLVEDYLLKQLTVSLMYPEKELGKRFWDKVYAKVRKQYGNVDIPMDSFHKVWIVPKDADVLQKDNRAFIVNSSLEVLTEEDYNAMRKSSGEGRAQPLGAPGMDADSMKGGPGTSRPTEIQTEVMREVIIPAIEKEVNEGRDFARLRQIYSAMVLAAWYKITLKESLLGKIYVDRNKIAGVHTDDPQAEQEIYDRYIAAFRKGVYDYIKEDEDPQSGQIIPRHYFSGGFTTKDGNGRDLIRKVKESVTILKKGQPLTAEQRAHLFRAAQSNSGGSELVDFKIGLVEDPDGVQLALAEAEETQGAETDTAMLSEKEFMAVVSVGRRSAKNYYKRYKRLAELVQQSRGMQKVVNQERHLRNDGTLDGYLSEDGISKLKNEIRRIQKEISSQWKDILGVLDPDKVAVASLRQGHLRLVPKASAFTGIDQVNARLMPKGARREAQRKVKENRAEMAVLTDAGTPEAAFVDTSMLSSKERSFVDEAMGHLIGLAFEGRTAHGVKEFGREYNIVYSLLVELLERGFVSDEFYNAGVDLFERNGSEGLRKILSFIYDHQEEVLSVETRWYLGGQMHRVFPEDTGVTRELRRLEGIAESGSVSPEGQGLLPVLTEDKFGALLVPDADRGNLYMLYQELMVLVGSIEQHRLEFRMLYQQNKYGLIKGKDISAFEEARRRAVHGLAHEQDHLRQIWDEMQPSFRAKEERTREIGRLISQQLSREISYFEGKILSRKDIVKMMKRGSDLETVFELYERVVRLTRERREKIRLLRDLLYRPLRLGSKASFAYGQTPDSVRHRITAVERELKRAKQELQGYLTIPAGEEVSLIQEEVVSVSLADVIASMGKWVANAGRAVVGRAGGAVEVLDSSVAYYQSVAEGFQPQANRAILAVSVNGQPFHGVERLRSGDIIRFGGRHEQILVIDYTQNHFDVDLYSPVTGEAHVKSVSIQEFRAFLIEAGHAVDKGNMDRFETVYSSFVSGKDIRESGWQITSQDIIVTRNGRQVEPVEREGFNQALRNLRRNDEIMFSEMGEKITVLANVGGKQLFLILEAPDGKRNTVRVSYEDLRVFLNEAVGLLHEQRMVDFREAFGQFGQEEGIGQESTVQADKRDLESAGVSDGAMLTNVMLNGAKFESLDKIADKSRIGFSGIQRKIFVHWHDKGQKKSHISLEKEEGGGALDLSFMISDRDFTDFLEQMDSLLSGGQKDLAENMLAQLNKKGDWRKIAAQAQENVQAGGDRAILTGTSPVSRVPITDHRSPITDVGGIDLNSEYLNLKIRRDGSGIPLPVSRQPLEELMTDVPGFTPVIIDMTPIPSLPLLLGLDGNTQPSGKQELKVGRLSYIKED